MSKKLTTNEVIQRFKKIHNNKYDYSKVNYTNNHTKVYITCPIHGGFYQSPYCHSKGQECKKCGNAKIRNKLLSNKKEFVNKSNIIHNNKYDYSKFIYKNAISKSIIICPIHGEFLQRPNEHLRMTEGCPKCGIIKCNITKRKLGIIYSNDEYIKKVRLVHGNKYDYSKVSYENSHKKICIICKKHGDFFQTPNSHLNGNGCPKCIHIISKSEIEFLNYVNISNKSEVRQKYIKPYKVDAYDIKTNTIYEFLGNYYHGNPTLFDLSDYNKKCHKTFGELYQRTFEKFKKLKSFGYNIKYIWELEWEKYKKGLNDKPNILTY